MTVPHDFLIFLLTGGLAAVVNFGSRWAYSHWMDFGTAVALAYITGMVTAFVLARAFVFTKSTQGMGRSALWFIVVNLVALVQTWVITMVLARWALPAFGLVRHVQEVAHAVGIMVPVVTSYLGHKHLSFR